MSGHTGAVTGVSFSPAGRQIVSCSLDGTLRLWSDDLPADSAALMDWLAAATNAVIGANNEVENPWEEMIQ